ncbi:HNH endonuclease [Brevibacterium casei]|uniref:HNH endonuclease signature motif containing protein n=1 Tax=Brevibacterium casei TaxID=33889 RepID=UPI00223BFE2B|nr:HNH endonuclease signature motif containing protein [Brevibacterium casei]MCT1445899.1 HNH endonuclease [Brevibacterium casei]
MTLTPDRQHPGDDSRSAGSRRGGKPAKGVGGNSAKNAHRGSASGQSSLFDQLRDAGFDLTGHSLADRFDEIPGVPGVSDCDEPERDGDVPFDPHADESVGQAGSAEEAPGHRPHDGDVTSALAADTPSPEAMMPDTRRLSRHSMLSDEEWSALSRFAPEVLDGITGLTTLNDELRSFERPMGPEEAVMLTDALEALDRVNRSLFAVTLAVFERVGTPTDFGVKTTKSLIQNRLGLTGAEANRRTELARNFGGRVDITGQAMPPLNPATASGLHDGTLSEGQASVIAECMKRLPTWVSAELREETEAKLVSEARRVRVSDIREIFQRMLDIIDPDGQEPSQSRDRADYSVHLRARRNGDWDLTGRLDPITGGLLNGLLTSRIESCRRGGAAASASVGSGSSSLGRPGSSSAGRPDSSSPGNADSAGLGGGVAGDCGTGSGADDDAFAVLDAVLSGQRHDAPMFAQDGSDAALDGSGQPCEGETSGAYGVREDGTQISTLDAQPTVRRWIYERFATLIGKIEMTRPTAGARYSLVVTAKAEDLAANTGSGRTGTENPVPIEELTASGLNGRVFFHLMSDQATTVQVATEKRFADEKQTAIITARDQGCSFPGCDSPPGWCEVHHIVPWAEEGRTDINNLTLACGAHHHLIDKSDWHAIMLTDGRPAWVPPASIDPARQPILHARFIARQIIDTLFDT